MGRDRHGNYLVEEDIVLMRLIALHLEDASAGCSFERLIEGFPKKNIRVKVSIQIEDIE